MAFEGTVHNSSNNQRFTVDVLLNCPCLALVMKKAMTGKQRGYPVVLNKGYFPIAVMEIKGKFHSFSGRY